MMKVALTGNVASGKSTVARIWEAAGVPTIRADDLAREVVAPGSQGLARVVEEFGPQLLLPDGTLDRDRLRQRVFRDPRERERLEEILHPLIRDLRDEHLRAMESLGPLLVVAEIPLLFEVGLEGEFDLVVLVDAPEEERLRRLVEDRGWLEEEGRRVMESQMPAAKKRSRAHFLLENGGTPQELEERALALLDLLRARARKGGFR